MLSKFDLEARGVYERHGFAAQSLHRSMCAAKEFVPPCLRNKVQKLNNAFRVIRHLDATYCQSVLDELEHRLALKPSKPISQACRSDLVGAWEPLQHHASRTTQDALHTFSSSPEVANLLGHHVAPISMEDDP